MEFTTNGQTNFELAHINTRDEKHGPSSVLAVDLTFRAVLSNTVLDQLNPELRPGLYKADPDYHMDLVEGEAPLTKLRVADIREKIKLPPTYTLTDYRVTIPYGGNPESALVYDSGTKVGTFQITPEEGGSVGIEFKVSFRPDSDAYGKIGSMLKSHFPLLIEKPATVEPPQTSFIDDDGGVKEKPANPFDHGGEGGNGVGAGDDLNSTERLAALAGAVSGGGASTEPRDPIEDDLDSPTPKQ